MSCDFSGVTHTSEGGFFDQTERQVGMVVRGPLLEDGLNFVRVVRMSYVVASLQQARLALSPEQRALVQPYLELTPDNRQRRIASKSLGRPAALLTSMSLRSPRQRTSLPNARRVTALESSSR